MILLLLLRKVLYIFCPDVRLTTSESSRSRCEMNALWLALLLSSVIWAEEEYFHISQSIATWNETKLQNTTWNETKLQNTTWNETKLQNTTWNETKLQNPTWDKARHHCQVCFKELTTITSRNVHLIVKQNLSLDYWIGLRKSFNGTIPWSRWSNGDPVTYQNWYPGHPVPNKVKKMIPKCYSTTQIPQSTLITTTTSIPATSFQTSRQTSKQTSPQTSTQISTKTSLQTSTQNFTQTSPQTSTQNFTQTSPQTSTQTSITAFSQVTSPDISSISQTNQSDMCPILNEILSCLNMTYGQLKNTVQEQTYVTTKYSTTANATTFSTAPDATTFSTAPDATTFSTPTNATTFSTFPNDTTFSTFPNDTTFSTTPNNTTFIPTPNATTFITTPNATTFSTTPNATTSAITTESTTASNCIFEPEPDPEVYIEDPCVVLLSFGMWKEINCNESQSFICYDDRFFGQINMSNVTTRSGNLNWSNAPGNITHYRVEIAGKNQTNETKQISNETVLYKQLWDLTPGNLYKVQVFPVKCGRDLNPQNISFYTTPSAVENLTVVSVKTDNVILNWSKPEGDCETYSVLIRNMLNDSTMNQDCDSELCTIKSLIPGARYEFTVRAIVNKTTGGVPSNVSDYTIPSKVSDLKSNDNDSTVITASWKAPSGYHSSYRYCLIRVNNSDKCIPEHCTNATTSSRISIDCSITKTEFIKEVNKTDGAKYCLCVAALTKDDTLSGEMELIEAFTKPQMVILSSLISNSQSMTANWTIDGQYQTFIVMINTSLDNRFLNNGSTGNLNYTFTDLKAGVQYTVSVITINGLLKSDPVVCSAYTIPTKPGPATASSNKSTIYLKWGVPEESKDAMILYNVKYNATFWGDRNETNTTYTNFTFPNLRPGTRYKFDVSVVAGHLRSSSVPADAITDPVKKKLIFTMVCSSNTPLHCEQKETTKEFLKKLNDTFKDKLNEDVYWKVDWADKNVPKS